MLKDLFDIALRAQHCANVIPPCTADMMRGCTHTLKLSSQDVYRMLLKKTGASDQTGKYVSDLIMWVKVIVSFGTGFVRIPFYCYDL